MRNRDARIAGVLYLVSIVVGFFDLEYIPDRFLIPGNAGASAHAIVSNEFLFRLGMTGDLIEGAVWLFTVLALYRLLVDVDRTQAKLMVILGAFMQVPLYFVNVLNYAAALMFADHSSRFLSAFSSAQRDAMVMFFLKLHNYEVLGSLLFAGLWLFPFALLVYKSTYLPRTLGALLAVNGVAWLMVCLCAFLTPQYSGLVHTITTPMNFGEILIALWLVIVGARTIGRSNAAESVTSMRTR